MEVWAGIECTVNRVGERYADQLARNGHAERDDDLERFAELGISAIRYPLLWERACDSAYASPTDWTWADRRLARLRTLGIRPIVGLVHHGSGPRDTNLLDPAFAERLAAYARAVAERYPWVEDWTPVNEPLTTARFAALYGYWYPHAHDDRSFVRACLSQWRAVALAMREVRRVNPSARLVQTEDLGRTFSTERLRYQADFENERRWLTYDALLGRITPTHPLYDWLRGCGAEEHELAWLAEHAPVPDLIGINHYLTSERFLDERIDRYPEHVRGGNGRDRYADVEALRVCEDGACGLRARLEEAWERYEHPIAVTEAHLACTREEQLRWLRDVWSDACAVRAAGADVRAVTAWSLLGAFDWQSLMTRDEGRYEPGVFDVRAPSPRPTALANMVRDLARRGGHEHPVLDGDGWWRSERRFLYPRHVVHVPAIVTRRAPEAQRPIAVIGARGTLGAAFVRACESRGLACRPIMREQCDATNAASVRAMLRRERPWAIVNAAGFVRVDDAERETEACIRDNVCAAATLADACAMNGIPLVTFSTDLVFDGALDRPYVESDAPRPLGVYGRSKLDAERAVLAQVPSSLVIRTAAFFGPFDNYNFVTVALRELEEGRVVRAAQNLIVSPTYVPDLVHASLDLLIDGERGVWHLANAGAITWAELARRAAELAGADASLIEPCDAASLGFVAARPRQSALASERGSIMPTLDDALGRYMHATAARRRAAREQRLEHVA